jgi:hypothetical protein
LSISSIVKPSPFSSSVIANATYSQKPPRCTAPHSDATCRAICRPAALSPAPIWFL